MEMFLMALCISVFGFAVTAAAFGAATRSQQPAPEEQPALQPVVDKAPAHFFGDGVMTPAPAFHSQVPIEALLLQIDNHVRLEHAAAESFLAYPTAAHLHGKTSSTWIH